jgi:hypothetical protein
LLIADRHREHEIEYDDHHDHDSSSDDDDVHESKRPRTKETDKSRRRHRHTGHRSDRHRSDRERKHKHRRDRDAEAGEESAAHKQTRLERQFASDERRPIANLIPEMSSRASVLVAASDKWPEPAYFIDGRPDPDNVRFGHPYRMHVPVHRLNARAARGLPPALFLRANDGAYKLVDAHDSNVAKAPARYFGDKHVAVALDRTNKRVIRGASSAAEALRAPLPLVAFVPLATTNSRTTAMTPAGAADEVEGETLQEHMFRRARQFNERLRATPHDVALWLEFAAFQEPFLRAQSDRVVDSGAIDDKRIAVLEAALRENADSDEVQLAYLEACGRRWDQSALERQWRTLLASNAANARLWLGYIAFRSSYFGTFSVGALRTVYAEAVASLMKARYSERDELIVRHLETAVLSIVVKYAVFERQAGYTERAVACLQALLEFNLFAPADVPQHRRLAAFGRFWESEAPRIGDVGAHGWRNSSAFDAVAAAADAAAAATATARALSPPPPPPPPPDDAVVGPVLDAELARAVRVRREAEQWCRRELQNDARLWQPIRLSIEPVADEADEAESDVERAVLFDDIRPFVVELSLPALHYELLCQLGSFFGFEAAPRRPTSHPLVRDRDDERESLAGVLDRVATSDDGDNEQQQQQSALYSDRRWRDQPRAPQNALAREFVRRAFELAARAWHEAASRRRTTAAALTTAMLPAHAATIELGALAPLAAATRLSGEHHRASMAAQQLLRLASARRSGAHDGALDAGALKAVRRAAKALLSERRDDLALWRAYAAAEHNNDNFDEARRILLTALASVELRGSSADAPAFALVHACVENELFQWRAPADLSEHVRIARASSALELLPLSEPHRRAALALAALANGQRYDESSAAPPLAELFGATRIVRMRAALRQRVAEADGAVADADSALRVVAQLRHALAGRSAAADAASAACADVQDDVSAESERRRDAQLSIHVIAAAFEFVLGAAGGPTAARLALGAALGTLDARSWRREALVCAWLRLEQLHAAVRREPPSHVAHVLQCALQDYPSNATLLAALIGGASGARARLGSGVRRYFDARCRPRTAGGAVATPLEWIMAIAAERKRAASGSRVRALFEKALGGHDWRHAAARHSIVLWRFYVHYELAVGDVRGALRVFFRAVRAVPWCKALWQELLATELVREATAAQVREVLQLMDEKEVRLRSKPPLHLQAQE